MHEMRLGPQPAAADGICWHITESRSPVSLCGKPIQQIPLEGTEEVSHCCDMCLAIYGVRIQETRDHSRSTSTIDEATARPGSCNVQAPSPHR